MVTVRNLVGMMCIWPTCEATHTDKECFCLFLCRINLLLLLHTHMDTHNGSWKLGQWKAPFLPLLSLRLRHLVDCSSIILVHWSLLGEMSRSRDCWCSVPRFKTRCIRGRTPAPLIERQIHSDSLVNVSQLVID